VGSVKHGLVVGVPSKKQIQKPGRQTGETTEREDTPAEGAESDKKPLAERNSDRKPAVKREMQGSQHNKEKGR